MVAKVVGDGTSYTLKGGRNKSSQASALRGGIYSIALWYGGKVAWKEDYFTCEDF